METTRWRGAPCRSGLVRKRRYLPGCNLQAVHMHFWWHLDAPGSNCVNEGFQKLSPTSGRGSGSGSDGGSGAAVRVATAVDVAGDSGGCLCFGSSGACTKPLQSMPLNGRIPKHTSR